MFMNRDDNHKNGSVTEHCRNCLYYYKCKEKLKEKFSEYGWCKDYIYDM